MSIMIDSKLFWSRKEVDALIQAYLLYNNLSILSFLVKNFDSICDASRPKRIATQQGVLQTDDLLCTCTLPKKNWHSWKVWYTTNAVKLSNCPIIDCVSVRSLVNKGKPFWQGKTAIYSILLRFKNCSIVYYFLHFTQMFWNILVWIEHPYKCTYNQYILKVFSYRFIV